MLLGKYDMVYNTLLHIIIIHQLSVYHCRDRNLRRNKYALQIWLEQFLFTSFETQKWIESSFAIKHFISTLFIYEFEYGIILYCNVIPIKSVIIFMTFKFSNSRNYCTMSLYKKKY